jgi:hypothetical protein
MLRLPLGKAELFDGEEIQVELLHGVVDRLRHPQVVLDHQAGQLLAGDEHNLRVDRSGELLGVSGELGRCNHHSLAGLLALQCTSKRVNQEGPRRSPPTA